MLCKARSALFADNDRQKIVAERKDSCGATKLGETMTELSTTERSVAPLDESPGKRASLRSVITEAKQVSR